MYILQKHNLNMLISNKLYEYDFTPNLHFLQKQFLFCHHREVIMQRDNIVV